VERAGPLWAGNLWDAALLDRLLADERPLATASELRRSLALWRLEADAPPLFFDLHAAPAALGRRGDGPAAPLPPIPTLDAVRGRLEARGHACVRTHFAKVGIRTDAPAPLVLALLSYR
jgi:tRNA G26 N,N-dimethylase Trm1